MGIDEVVDSGWTVETLKELMDERHKALLESITREREERREREIKNNEFRGQLEDQAATFVTRNEMEAKLATISQRLEAEVKSLEQQLKSKNIQIIASFSFGLLATLVAVFNTATRLAGG